MDHLCRTRPVRDSPCRRRASGLRPPPRPFKSRPSRSSSKAATSSPPPRPAPARRRRSRCRPGHARAAPRAEAAARSCCVVTPTRELAQQIGEVMHAIAAHHATTASLTVVGGAPLRAADQASSTRGVDVLIATPGRLIDLMEQQARRPVATCRCSCWTRPTACSTWAFWPAVTKIVDATPAERQTLLFSATIDRVHPEQRGHAAERPGHRARSPTRARRPTPWTSTSCACRQTAEARPSARRVLKERGHEARHRVRPHAQTAPTPPAAAPEARRLPRRGHPLRPHPEPAPPRAGQLRLRRDRRPRGHRRAGPRHRRATRWTTWSTTTCPTQAGGLRAPHRPHRPGRRERASPSPSSAPRTEDALRDIEKLIKRRHPRDRDRGLQLPKRPPRPRPSAPRGQRPPRPRAGGGRPRARQEGEAPRQGEGARRAGCRRVAPARHAQEAGRQERRRRAQCEEGRRPKPKAAPPSGRSASARRARAPAEPVRCSRHAERLPPRSRPSRRRRRQAQRRQAPRLRASTS